MPCFHPAKAFRTTDGVTFAQLRRHDIVGDITLPCGQCVGCRLDRARDWSVRCLHEAKMHEENSFITLTYSDDHLPPGNSLDYSHFQKFMRALRKKAGVKLRFFMCGEYGEKDQRAHFHALLFGYDFADKKYWSTTPSGHPLYRSELLETLWGKGHCWIGAVSRESAGYVARYCLKKVTGDQADAHYQGRTPEFARMSLKPGLGAKFFEKFTSDILPNDYVICDGIKIPVPRYYEKLYASADLDQVKHRRELYARSKADNNTPERLATREEVVQAKLRQLKRTL